MVRVAAFLRSLRQQSESVQTRHHDIAEDQVGRVGEGGGKGFIAVGDGSHLESLPKQA